MPPKAEVVIIEDEKAWRDRMLESLAEEKHHVVAEPTCLKDALVVLENIRDHKIDADVIILGGHLGEGDINPTSPKNDSQVILFEMKKMGLDIPTIGMSALNVPGTDVDLGKNHLYPLGRLVTSF